MRRGGRLFLGAAAAGLALLSSPCRSTSQAVPLGGFLEEAESALLQEDDACAFAGDSAPASGPCALSALQLRGGRLRSTAEGGGGEGETREEVLVSTYEELREIVQNSKSARIQVETGAHVVLGGTINIDQKKSFDIWSEGATIDGAGDYEQVRLFYVSGGLKLTGFVLKNGKTNYGGGMYLDIGAKANIANCSFEKNAATQVGGAIAIKGAQLTLHNVSFRQNVATNEHLRRTGHSKVGRSNAVYVMLDSEVDVTMTQQPENQDWFFDHDFDGNVTFHCALPKMSAETTATAKQHVHKSPTCDLEEAAPAEAPPAADGAGGDGATSDQDSPVAAYRTPSQ